MKNIKKFLIEMGQNQAVLTPEQSKLLIDAIHEFNSIAVKNKETTAPDYGMITAEDFKKHG